MKQRILLVDDEAGIRASLTVTLEPIYDVVCASDANQALGRFRRESPSLVLLDIILPGMDGLALLKTMRTEDPSIPVIMLTGTKTVKTAVDAMKLVPLPSLLSTRSSRSITALSRLTVNWGAVPSS